MSGIFASKASHIELYREPKFAYKGKQEAWQPIPTGSREPFNNDRGVTTYIAAFPVAGYDRFGVRSQALSEHGPCKMVPLQAGTNLPMRLVEGRLMEHIGHDRPRSAVPAVKKSMSKDSMRASFHNPHPLRRRVIEDLREEPMRRISVSARVLRRQKAMHERFIPHDHPTRDFDALDKPSAHAALKDTVSSSCDQVESTVKAVEVAQIPRRVTRHRKGEESAAQAEARSQAEIDQAAAAAAARDAAVAAHRAKHTRPWRTGLDISRVTRGQDETVRVVEQRQEEKRSARPASAAASARSSTNAPSSSVPAAVELSESKWFTQGEASNDQPTTYQSGPLKGKTVPARTAAHHMVPVDWQKLPSAVTPRPFILGDPAATDSRSFTTTNRAEFVAPSSPVAAAAPAAPAALSAASPRFAVSSAGVAKGRAFSPLPRPASAREAQPAASVSMPKWTPRTAYADSFEAPKNV